MIRKIFLFFVFYTAAGLCAAQSIEIYFSPDGGCQEVIISEIKKATQTIDIAMYYLTSRQIARALAQAQQYHKVRVRIVLDKSQERQRSSKSGYLLKHGFDLRYHRGAGLMHNKFAIIDGELLITGSFNWTITAEEKNEENLLIITDDEAIEKYQERFDYLWNASRLDSRDVGGSDDLSAWFCRTLHLFCRN